MSRDIIYLVIGSSHGRMAQLVEHIVHIDGVTGSSPVATTIIPRIAGFEGFFMFPRESGNRPAKNTGMAQALA